MVRPYKKPKYKLDVKKFETAFEQQEKKDKDWQDSEVFNEILKSKLKSRHR